MVRLYGAFLVALLLSASAKAAGTVEITGTSDLALGSWGIGNPAISASIDVCIGTNGTSPVGSYAVTVTGSNGYKLTNGSNQLPYSLAWEDSGAGNLGSATGTTLASGVLLDNQINANTAFPPLCIVGGPTARLHVKIAQADLTAALAGTYSGTLTFVISPP